MKNKITTHDCQELGTVPQPMWVEGGCGWKAAENKPSDIGTRTYIDCRKFTVGRKKKTLPQLRQNITEASVAG